MKKTKNSNTRFCWRCLQGMVAVRNLDESCVTNVVEQGMGIKVTPWDSPDHGK